MTDNFTLEMHTSKNGKASDDEPLGYNDFTIYLKGKPFLLEGFEPLETTILELRNIIAFLNKLELVEDSND